MLSSFSLKAGVYMHVWECLLWPALPCFPTPRHRCGGSVRRSGSKGRRLHLELCRTEEFLERNSLSSVQFFNFRRYQCSTHMCGCGVVNKHFSWSGDGLERAALISNIIYLLYHCVRDSHAQTQTHAVTEILQFIPSRTNDQPHSLSPRLSSPFVLPSFPKNQWSVLSPKAVFVQYSSKVEGKKAHLTLPEFS